MDNMSPMSVWFEEHRRRKTAKWIAVVLMILAAFLLVKTIKEIKEFHFIGRSESPTNVITVSGKGEVLAKADIATLSFSVQEESLVVKEAQEKAAKKINAVMAFLTEKGIAEKDIKTTGYSIYPRYEYGKTTELYPPFPNGERYLAGYEISQTTEVKVRVIEDIGELLAGIGELGVTNLSGPAFSNDKEDELRKEARGLAIKDARADAEALANDLGVSLARIINFSESGNYPGPIYFKAASLEVADGRGGATPEITPGENKITATVTITYEIR